ncbi:hypothetical protein ACJIZ3_024996 [Penstemon smallii]|uniref:Trimethylguanosine synthase n=1 Tax=Penstemon smallii TaxID=265156 RepID=A0ABD3TUD5_9LAMI
MKFSIDESPAIKALGPLFKLTEVRLWDEGSSGGLDYERDDLANIHGFGLLPEDVEEANKMNDLGLPLSFHTNKKRYGTNNRKRRGTRKNNQQSPTEIDNIFFDSIKLSEEESESPAILLDTSQMLDQNEIFNHDNVEDVEVLENPNSVDWITCWDDFYMRVYFYNVKTEESKWNPPKGLEHLLVFHIADEPSNSIVELGEMINDQFPEECINDSQSLSQEFEEISENLLCADNVSSTNSTKRKKKTNSRRKLSISSEDSQGVLQEVTPIISKYWCQRYRLFSRFDDGIKMDEEGWFSVTPEILAKHHAFRCGSGSIVDFFTGVGGNAIQFAQRSKHVIAVDIDPNKIEYAQHNAAIYGVDDHIDFVRGDSFSLAPKLKVRNDQFVGKMNYYYFNLFICVDIQYLLQANTVFMSPPWGGPDYSKVKKFDINSMLRPEDGQFLFDVGMGIAPKIVMFLPRNVDVDQLAELSLSASPPWSLEVSFKFFCYILNYMFTA